MSPAETFLYAIGVMTCSIGAFAILGFIAWQGLELWVRFNTIRGPLMRFYAGELKRKHGEEFGHD